MIGKEKVVSVIAAATLFGLFTNANSLVFAQSTSPTPSPTTKTRSAANNTNHIASIKSRSEAEIDKRLSSLNTAAAKINAATKLSSADKTNFSSQIQTDIINLTMLRAKIDADTDLATLRTDAKNIFTDFRVYAVFLPQVHELSAVDIMGVTADNLTNIANKLQARIQTAQTNGMDISQLQTLLTDMQSKIADAKIQYTAVESEISPLTPANYPGSNTTLKDGRSKIKAGTGDLKAAWQDARKIAQGLKALNSAKNTTGGTSSSQVTR